MSEFKDFKQSPLGQKLAKMKELLEKEAIPAVLKQLEGYKTTIEALAAANKMREESRKDG